MVAWCYWSEVYELLYSQTCSPLSQAYLFFQSFGSIEAMSTRPRKDSDEGVQVTFFNRLLSAWATPRASSDVELRFAARRAGRCPRG